MLKADDILKVLPHRYPFLLVDRVEEVSEGKVKGYKCVSFNEPFFQGHFPGKPIMPGVLIIEAIAQVGAFLILAKPEYTDKMAYFAGIDKARFRKPVYPGDKLEIETVLLRFRGVVGKIKGTAFVNGELVTEAEITFSLVDKINKGV